MSESGTRHDEVRPANEARWIRRLAVYCWRFKRDVIISLGGSVLYTATALLIPLLQRSIIDNVIVTRQESVWPLAIALAVAAVAGFVGVYLRRYRGGKMALDVQHTMRTELFESLSGLDGARQDEIHTGQLVGRSISDINMVQGLLQWVPLILGSLLLFVFSLVIMITLSPLLSLVALAVAPGALADRQRVAAASCSRPAGTRSRWSATSPGSSTRRSAASAWSRGSARKSRRWSGWRRRAGNCSAPGSG